MTRGIFLASLVFALVAEASVLRVGPGERFRRPSEAAALARDGDRVEIAPGEYRGDACAWSASDLDIRGAGPGMTVIDAAGGAFRGKGAWVIAGDRVRISGVGFWGAKCEDRNGAGIRLEGAGLVVSNCVFVDNENGILTGASPKSEVEIVDTVFRGNGAGDGYSHNLYAGKLGSLRLTRVRSDHARGGHALKSRALATSLVDCVFDDGDDGETSYLADFPNGGAVAIRGTKFRQSPRAANRVAVSVGEEGPYPGSRFSERDNVFELRRENGQAVRLAPGVDRE